ncbi:MAG: copper resistance protein CopC [Gammaproteobacteria bacterium]|nr:copper resistance protein CopC [Gammaproteobacteria bacterium]
MTQMLRATLLVFLLPIPGLAAAHAFPERSRPRVGATLHASPPLVRIWFDAGLEGLFCHLTVKTPAGATVSRGRARVAAHSRDRLLEVAIPPLAPGKYRVDWSVIAVDGHHTEGHYSFRIKP